MTAQNPYAAPQASYSPQTAGALQALDGQAYVPLGWRTALAAVSVLGMTLVDAVMRVAQLALGDSLASSLRGSSPDLATIAIVGAAGVGVLVMSVCAWVFVPVWFHRASANLRGLGRYGMEFSPAGCAGWFFVPIANLWKPAQAAAELWRASDPDGKEGSWVTSAGTSLVAVWWSAYLVAGFVSWGSILAKSVPSSAATIGLASTGFRAVAALALVLLMRGISARQERAAAQLGA